jgi:hypothetical protein
MSETTQSVNSVLLSENERGKQTTTSKEKCNNVLFNVFVGQIIAIALVSGGIFTKNLQELNIDAPLIQLTFMYMPLCGYLIYHFTAKGQYTEIAIWKLFLCSVVDCHATILIVFAYTQTTLTSVMIIEDFSIPSAVLLSLIVLKV